MIGAEVSPAGPGKGTRVDYNWARVCMWPGEKNNTGIGGGVRRGGVRGDQKEERRAGDGVEIVKKQGEY